MPVSLLFWTMLMGPQFMEIHLATASLFCCVDRFSPYILHTSEVWWARTALWHATNITRSMKKKVCHSDDILNSLCCEGTTFQCCSLSNSISIQRSIWKRLERKKKLAIQQATACPVIHFVCSQYSVVCCRQCQLQHVMSCGFRGQKWRIKMHLPPTQWLLYRRIFKGFRTWTFPRTYCDVQ